MQSNQNSPNKQLPPLPENAHQSSQQIPIFYTKQTRQMSNLSLGGSRSMQSMQSMGSSEAIIMPPPETILQNQTFPVIYRNRAYMVDPAGLVNASFKVKELVDPFLKNNFPITELRLQVIYCIFTNRNMENFLKICQNLPADVQNSEMKEICEIAKMFQADNIYNCGIDFIHKYIDPNFFVSETKYSDKPYLIVECDDNVIHHDNLAELNFQENSDYDYSTGYNTMSTNINSNNSGNIYSSNNNCNISANNNIGDGIYNTNSTIDTTNTNIMSSNDNGNSNNSKNKSPYDLNSNNDNNNDIEKDKTNTSSNNNTNPSTADNIVTTNATNSNPGNSNVSPDTGLKSVVYMIRHINHGFKCTTFTFSKDHVLLYTAKLKENHIYIGEGNEVHISNKKNHVAHILRKDNNLNVIQIGDLQFELSYVPSGRPKHLSISVSFPLQDKKIIWNPKTPKFDPIENKYYLNFHGQSGHTPIKSSKNIVLANAQGHTAFIVRKIGYLIYEAECFPIVDPLIVFTIGLSDIVGPYLDPLGDIVI